MKSMNGFEPAMRGVPRTTIKLDGDLGRATMRSQRVDNPSGPRPRATGSATATPSAEPAAAQEAEQAASAPEPSGDTNHPAARGGGGTALGEPGAEPI